MTSRYRSDLVEKRTLVGDLAGSDLTGSDLMSSMSSQSSLKVVEDMSRFPLPLFRDPTERI